MIRPDHFRTPLVPTPFHPRTAALNLLHRWGDWAGCVSALCFGDPAMEHTAIRNAASLYDISPMIKYRIEGPGAADVLNRLGVRDVRRVTPGGVQYTAWADDAGQLLDDGTLFRLAPDRWRLCAQERHLPWLCDTARGFDVTVTDETEAVAALSLQGPCAAAVLRAAGVAVDGLRPFRCMDARLGGAGVMVSRTGFTGDLGYELWLDPADALSVWDALMAAGAPWGLRPVGSDALNLARIEAGFLLPQVDFIPADQALREDRTRSVIEMGLGWLIDWDKGPFTGRAALAAERARGSAWAFVGLDIPGNIAAEGAILYHRRTREVGTVTSAAWSPMLKANIAMAQVRAGHADGRDLWVEIYAMRELHYAKMMLPVRVVDRPFLRLDRRHATPPGDV